MATLLAPPTTRTPADNAQMRDGHGRRIDYLRLSVTDRCDLRCTYCMDPDTKFLPRDRLLSTDELVGIAEAFIDRGIRKIRLTGGEPLTRRDIAAVAQRIGARIGAGLDELTLTTNGTQLARHARALADAGVRRINVSIDTLDANTFRQITRGGDLSVVLAGIDAAVAAGIAIRINMVALAGVNDAALLPMVAWCDERDFDLALIESMPMGSVAADRSTSHVALPAFIAPLGAATPITHRTAGPARYVTVPGRNVRIGLITPISQNFCDACNRIRMTAEGRVHPCLGFDDATDLAGAWRADDAAGIAPLIDRLLATKPLRHEFRIGAGLAPSGPTRHMSATGG